VARLRTPRLLLRQWRDADLAPFATLNADPEVTEHLPARLTRTESDEMARFLRAAIAAQGWGLWAVEIPDQAPFIGFVGLNEPRFEAHFTPAVEIGWRLARAYWGYGYATEAAWAALRFAFAELQLDEVVSMTATVNLRSQRVMQRLGMVRDPADDFEHPRVPPGPLRPHVLYRLARGEWQQRTVGHHAPDGGGAART
jgi:RimJ/RimL family protein N-acetyltransferase